MAANNVRLRTNIIDRLGPDIQDPDWNPDLVAADILAALTLTPTQARELSDHWQALPVERFCELRDVKNTTAPLQRLLRHLQPGPIRDQAREWLTIRELLSLSNEQGRPRHARRASFRTLASGPINAFRGIGPRHRSQREHPGHRAIDLESSR
jgi:hypothetical protein